MAQNPTHNVFILTLIRASDFLLPEHLLVAA